MMMIMVMRGINYLFANWGEFILPKLFKNKNRLSTATSYYWASSCTPLLSRATRWLRCCLFLIHTKSFTWNINNFVQISLGFHLLISCGHISCALYSCQTNHCNTDPATCNGRLCFASLSVRDLIKCSLSMLLQTQYYCFIPMQKNFFANMLRCLPVCYMHFY